MAHMAKYPKSSTGQLCQHYERKKDSDGNYIKFGNRDIDLSITHENYNLAPDRNQVEFIRQRCSEVQCMNRKDVNVLCSWVVTAPKDLPANNEQQFFQASYDFLQNRYGGEKNVISAFVHKDEATPHMHFAFVPVTIDKKKGIEKVSAKEVITKTDLQMFHSDLEDHMKKIFGHEIGIQNDATRNGNKSIEELKRQSAADRLFEADQEADKIISHAKEVAVTGIQKMNIDKQQTDAECVKMVKDAKKQAQGINDSLALLERKYDEIKSFLNEVTELEQADVSLRPDYIKISRSILGKETVSLPKEKWDQNQEALQNLLHKDRVGQIERNSLHSKLDFQKQDNQDVRAQNRKLMEKSYRNERYLKHIQEVFNFAPETAKAFYAAEESMRDMQMHQSHEMENPDQDFER